MAEGTRILVVLPHKVIISVQTMFVDHNLAFCRAITRGARILFIPLQRIKPTHGMTTCSGSSLNMPTILKQAWQSIQEIF